MAKIQIDNESIKLDAFRHKVRMIELAQELLSVWCQRCGIGGEAEEGALAVRCPVCGDILWMV